MSTHARRLHHTTLRLEPVEGLRDSRGAHCDHEDPGDGQQQVPLLAQVIRGTEPPQGPEHEVRDQTSHGADHEHDGEQHQRQDGVEVAHLVDRGRVLGREEREHHEHQRAGDQERSHADDDGHVGIAVVRVVLGLGGVHVDTSLLLVVGGVYSDYRTR